MNVATLNLLAERHLGLATYEDYVDWAVGCLEADIDSKNIRILASLRKPLYSSEVDEYFKRSLNDLGWTPYEREECLLEYARAVAQQILSAATTPAEGCGKIYRVVVALEYPRELEAWTSLYWSYELEGKEWDDEIMKEARRLVE